MIKASHTYKAANLELQCYTHTRCSASFVVAGVYSSGHHESGHAPEDPAHCTPCRPGAVQRSSPRRCCSGCSCLLSRQKVRVGTTLLPLTSTYSLSLPPPSILFFFLLPLSLHLPLLPFSPSLDTRKAGGTSCQITFPNRTTMKWRREFILIELFLSGVRGNR